MPQRNDIQVALFDIVFNYKCICLISQLFLTLIFAS